MIKHRSIRFSRGLLATILAVSFPLGLLGCAGTYQHKLEFNPQESIRVAVMPAVQVDGQGQFVEANGELLIDKVPLLSDTGESPTQIVRKGVQSFLSQKTKLDLISPAMIDVELPHHGFVGKNGKVDYRKLYDTSPQTICVHYIDCDAILYSYIKNWDRSYYGVQSVNAVEIEFKLVASKTGKVLFSSSGKDSESRGLTKGPTGYSSVVLEPIRGLDSEIIVELANQVVAQTLSPLASKKKTIDPNISPPAIFAVSHDRPSGSLQRTDPLVVVMFGSPGMSASFSIGSAIAEVPMVERSEGHYFGEFFPLETDMFAEQKVIVSLKDDLGRETKRIINEKPLTLVGLLTQ